MALTLTNAEIVLGLPIITDFIEKANDGSTTTVESLACKGLDEEELEGDLDETQRQRLLQIADMCPAHKTLHNEMLIESRLV